MFVVTADVSVQNEPLIVFGLVGVLLAAVVLAVLFAVPWRSLSQGGRRPTASELARLQPPSDDLPWMPGGDIFERQPGLHDAATPVVAAEPPGDPMPGAGRRD